MENAQQMCRLLILPMNNAANLRSLLAGRYRLGTVIGIGGFGTVYDAFDVVTQSRVAVKSLREVDPQRLFLFKQEFRLLSDVRHAQLVRYYELFQDRERWYLAMEHIEGVDVLSHVRGSYGQSPHSTTMTHSALSGVAYDKDGREITPARVEALGANSDVLVANEQEIQRLRALLPQLASGLEHLHSINLVHRDLTPRNIMMEASGRLVILDFGLALRGSGTSIMRNMRVGTPKYMAPEQVSNEPSTPAADWYAVGSIMYEMLTGIAPFVGSATQVINAKRTSKPINPLTLHPHLPEDLCALTMDLLEIVPANRPAHAAERLRQCAISTNRMRAMPRVPAALPFIGREPQLAQLDVFWRSSKNENKPAVVVVRGLSGMGKSALVERFFEKLPQGNQLIFRSRCYQHELAPFKAFDGLADALGEYLHDLSDEQLAEILPDDIGYVTRLFPSLAMVPAIHKAAKKLEHSGLDPHELRRRGFLALRTLFAVLSQGQRVVLFIDDIQWGDDDSLLALVDILAPEQAPPIFLLMSSRTEDDGVAAIERIAHAFQRIQLPLQVVEIGPLTSADVQALEARLQVDEKELRPLMQTVFRDSGGHPLYMRELIAAGLSGSGMANQPTLRDLIASRLLGLSAMARQLIEIAAIAGRPRPLALLHAAIQQGDNLAAAIHQLGADRLARLRTVGKSEELTVYHDKVAETAIALLSKDKLNAHHAALARALLAEANPEAEAEAISMHLLACGDKQRGWDYGVIAAERATQALAFERAATLYRMLLPLMPSDANRPEFLFKMASVLANAGYGVESARHYLEAANDPRCSKRQDALQLSAGQFLRSGYMDDGLLVAKQVLKEVGLRWHNSAKSALFSLLIRRLWLRMRGIHYQERKPSETPESERIKMDALWSLGHGLGGVDTIRGAEFHIRHLLMALKAGDPYRIGRGLAWESILNATEGHAGGRRRAVFYYQAAQNIATQLNNEHASAWSWAAAGYDYWCQGQWEQAVACSEKAARGYREECHDITWELGSVYAWSWLPVLCYSGQLQELRRLVNKVEREFGQLNDLYTLVTMRTVVTPWLALADGEPNRAVSDSHAAVESWSKKHWHLQHLFARMAAVRAALYDGESRQAWDLINECWPRYQASMQNLLQNKRMFMHDLRAQAGVMCLIKGELPVNETWRIERDIKQLENEKTRWAHAYALGHRAGLAYARQRPDIAAEFYAQARAAFQEQQMPLHEAAALIRLGTTTNQADHLTQGSRALEKLGVREPLKFAAMLLAGPPA
jgi:eukaryotic-like serine/threonine-protein kinase